MLPLIIAMQVGTPTAQPPPPPAGPTWDQPFRKAPATPAPPAVPPPPEPPEEEREVNWFARLDFGFGTYGFSETSELLTEMGYAGMKMWVTLDVAWMFHRHVGAGILLGVNRRSSQPESAPDLNVASYFVVAELPILLAGNRVWAFHLTPRGGYAAAQLAFDNDQDSDINHTGTFGGAVSFQSFMYHLGASVGFMRTPTGPQGALGRNMDFGGLYFTLGGTIDG